MRDRWGIFHAQPLVLNEQRQAGAAIEGVMRHEELEIAQLAVHTHGYTSPWPWRSSWGLICARA